MDPPTPNLERDFQSTLKDVRHTVESAYLACQTAASHLAHLTTLCEQMSQNTEAVNQRFSGSLLLPAQLTKAPHRTLNPHSPPFLPSTDGASIRPVKDIGLVGNGQPIVHDPVAIKEGSSDGTPSPDTSTTSGSRHSTMSASQAWDSTFAVAANALVDISLASVAEHPISTIREFSLMHDTTSSPKVIDANEVFFIPPHLRPPALRGSRNGLIATAVTDLPNGTQTCQGKASTGAHNDEYNSPNVTMNVVSRADPGPTFDFFDNRNCPNATTTDIPIAPPVPNFDLFAGQELDTCLKAPPTLLKEVSTNSSSSEALIEAALASRRSVDPDNLIDLTDLRGNTQLPSKATTTTAYNSVAFLAAANNAYTAFERKHYASRYRSESFEKGESLTENTASEGVSIPTALTNVTNKSRLQSVSAPIDYIRSSIFSTAATGMPLGMNPKADPAVASYVIYPNCHGVWYELETQWKFVRKGRRYFYVLVRVGDSGSS